MQGLVFKHLLGNLFVKGEAKGLGLGLQNTEAASNVTQKSRREAGCAVPG